MTPRILFICKERQNSYGITVGLINSSKFLSAYLNKKGYISYVAEAFDNNSIDRLIHKYLPTHVVIEALWVVPSKIEELLLLHKKLHWTIRCHSRIPFLSMEGVAMEWIYQYRQLQKRFPRLSVSFNAKNTTEEMNDVIRGLNSLYLPNVYCLEKTKANNCCCQEIHRRKSCDVLDIGCFGAIRPLKNQLLQAVSAIRYANMHDINLNFHINAGRTEQKGSEVLRNIKGLFDANPQHQLIEHGWLKHSDFLSLVRQMDLGMQVSYSESFNIVTADFVKQNVPIIVSPDIDWMPSVFMADPNSSASMVDAIDNAIALSGLGLHRMNNLCLFYYNWTSGKKWIDYLNGSLKENH